MKLNKIKKFLLSILAVSMIVTMIPSAQNHVHAEEEISIVTNTSTDTVTSAQMIINSYKLTSKEISILSHNTIKSTVFEFERPTNDDLKTLLNVDLSKKVITVQNYTDEYNNVWQPVKAIIVEEGKQSEYKISYGTCSFESSSDDFKIQIVYQLYGQLDEVQQLDLLNAPYWLVKGIESIENISKVASDLEIFIDSYFNILVGLKDGTLGVSALTGKYAESVNELEKQINKSTSGYFYINDKVSEYKKIYRLNKRQEFLYSDKATSLLEETRLVCSYLTNILNELEVVQSNEEYKDLRLDEIVYLLKEDILLRLSDVVKESNFVALEKQLLSNTVGNTGLTSVINKSGTVNDYSNTTLKDSLLMAETVLENSVSSQTVSVVIKANVVKGKDSSDLTLLETNPISVSVAAGSTSEEIIAYITSASFLTTIAKDLNVDYKELMTHYEVHVNTEGSNYTVTYTPMNYSISFKYGNNETLTLPYGYQITLPKAGSAIKYNYIINGESYDEGKVYKVVGNTVIERQAGRRLLGVLAMDINYKYSDLAKSILSSNAIKSDYVDYRRPTINDVKPTLEYNKENNTYTVSASSYASGIKDMTWIPVGFTIIKDGVESTKTYTLTNGKATINEGIIGGVNIIYELKVTKTLINNPISVTSKYLLNYINLPSTLLTESKSQIETLDQLLGMAGNGGYLTQGKDISSALSMLEMVYESYVKDPNKVTTQIKKEYNAIKTLRQNCFNANGQLYVYEYILKYKELGLIAYYSNEYGYQQYKVQFDTLVTNLNIVADAEIFNNLIGMFDSSYKGKITKLVEVLDGMELVAPNKYVDATHPEAPALFNILEENYNQTLEKYSSSKGLTDRVVLNVASEGQVNLDIIVRLDGQTYGSTSLNFDEGTVVSVQTLDVIQNAINSISNLNPRYYTNVKEITLPTLGSVLTDDFTLEENWESNKYQIIIKENDKEKLLSEITYGNATIKLEKPSLDKHRYDYTVLNEVISAETEDATLVISPKNFDSLFSNGKLVITRKLVDVERDNITTLFEAFNHSLEGLNSGFVLVKDGDKYKAILRLDPNEMSQITEFMMSFVLEIRSSKYSYVAMGKENQLLWDGSKMSMQVYIDSMLQSDFSMQSMIDAIGEDGDINENVKNYVSSSSEVIIGDKDDLNTLGGLLYKTNMYLGNSASSLSTVDYIVSIEDFDTQKDMLKTMREGLVRASNSMTYDTEGDRMNFNVQFTDMNFNDMLGGLIASGYIKIEDINSVTMSMLWDYIETQYEPLIRNDKTTSSTLTNTYKELGLIGSSISNETLDSIISILGDTDFVEDELTIENGMSGAIVIDLVPLLKQNNIPEELYVILKETELKISSTMVCRNLEEEIDALVYNNAQGTIHFSNDITKETIASDSIVILVKDITADIPMTNGILDVNGKTYTGTLNSNVVLVDSSFKTNNNYKYFTIQEVDGQIVVEFEANFFLHMHDYTVLKDVALDLALALGLQGFGGASYSIGNYKIFDLNDHYKNLGEFYNRIISKNTINETFDDINYDQLTAFIHDFVKQVTEFELYEEVLVDYDVVIKPWKVDLVLNEEKDYFECVLGSNSELAETKQLVIKVKTNEQVINVMNVLDKTLNVELKDYTLNDLNYSHGVVVNETLKGVIANVMYQDDMYTVLMGAMVAYNLEDNTALVTALNNYITLGTINTSCKANLMDVMEKVTFKQLIDSIRSIESNNVSFEEMSTSIGLVEYEKADEIEKVLNDILDYAIEKLNKHNIQGTNEYLEFDENGTFTWTYNNVTVNMNMFAEKCFHTSTHVENKKGVTCLEDGYTGDLICDVCHSILEKGHVIEALGHNYVNGICKNCNEKDPDYVAPYPRGDVNGDMEVNSLDYIVIRKHIMGTKTLTNDELARADVSGDGSVNSLDYIKIRKHIMGTKPLF